MNLKKATILFSVAAILIFGGIGCITEVQPTLPKSNPVPTDEISDFRIDGYESDGTPYQLLNETIKDGIVSRTKRYSPFYHDPSMIGGATTSIQTDETSLDQGNPNINYGEDVYCLVIDRVGNSHRCVVRIPITSSTQGIITAVDLNIPTDGVAGIAGRGWMVKALTRSDWTEGDNSLGSGATWNSFKSPTTTNTWTTAGGDFSATTIDTIASCPPGPSTVVAGLQGDNSENPLTISFGDILNLIFLTNENNEDGDDTGCKVKSSEFPTTITVDITYNDIPSSTPSSVQYNQLILSSENE